MIHFETRWALMVDEPEGHFTLNHFLVGRFFWLGATQDDIQVPTFRTRRLAREAKKKMRSQCKEAKVVKVVLTIETVKATKGELK